MDKIKMKEKFSGVFTALVTPFLKGQIDYKSLKQLIRAQLDSGIQGFVVNGTTGESPTLSEPEREELFKFVRKETGDTIPLLMGTGTFSTETSVHQTQRAEKLKADGVLVVTPYYNKPPQRGLIAHFESIAQCTELPVILYNVPGRSVVEISVETVAHLSHIKNIIGIKEASGDLEYGEKVLNSCGRGFLVTSGDDGTFPALTFKGGRGVISVVSHVIPKQILDICDRTRKKKSMSVEAYEPFQKLTKLLFAEANPIPVKYALKLMGIIESDELRLPLVPLEESLRVKLKAEMLNLGLL